VGCVADVCVTSNGNFDGKNKTNEKNQISIPTALVSLVLCFSCVVGVAISAPSPHRKLKHSIAQPKTVVQRKAPGTAVVAPAAGMSMPGMAMPGMSMKHTVPLKLGADRPPVQAPPLPNVGFGVPINLWVFHPDPSVIVSCDIGNDGIPTNLVLKSYSGNDSVDHLAMDAVRHLQVPPDPNGLGVRQLTFLCKGFRQ